MLSIFETYLLQQRFEPGKLLVDGVARQSEDCQLRVLPCVFVEKISGLIEDGIENLFDTTGSLAVFEHVRKEHGLEEMADTDRSMVSGSMPDFVSRS